MGDFINHQSSPRVPPRSDDTVLKKENQFWLNQYRWSYLIKYKGPHWGGGHLLNNNNRYAENQMPSVNWAEDKEVYLLFVDFTTTNLKWATPMCMLMYPSLGSCHCSAVLCFCGFICFDGDACLSHNIRNSYLAHVPYPVFKCWFRLLGEFWQTRVNPEETQTLRAAQLYKGLYLWNWNVK